MAKKFDRIPSFIQTYSGVRLEPLDLKPEDIVLEDIAHHTANQCRWSGATRHHYSVAQHAWYTSYDVPEEFAFDALMHDAPEYILQDMAKPLKNHVTLGRAYRGAEQRIEKVIGALYLCRFPDTLPEVKAADLRMLCAEADQLMHGRGQWGYYTDTTPADVTIVKWSPEKAKKKWLARYREIRRDNAPEE